MTVSPDTFEDDAPLFGEALDWVVHLKAGEPTADDLEAFEGWRRQSDDHEEALREALRVFRLAGMAARELHDEGRLDAPVPTPAPSWWSRPLARRAVISGAPLAAGLAYAVVRPPFELWPSLAELRADYRTGKGERRRMEIAAGVSLELDTQTSIAVHTADDETRVELISGQTFAAAQAAAVPLVLVAGNGRITASDASFDGRCLDGIVTVTCLHGTITVDHGGTVTTLAANQQLTYSKAGLQPPAPADPHQVSAWQSGELFFSDRPLASVVDEINRYRPGLIIIASDRLKGRLVNASFQVDRLDSFFPQVEQLFGARVTRLPGGVVVLS